MSYEKTQKIKYLQEIAETQKKIASRLWWIKWILLLPILLTGLYLIVGGLGITYLFNL